METKDKDKELEMELENKLNNFLQNKSVWVKSVKLKTQMN